MMSGFIEKVVGDLGHKKRWRDCGEHNRPVGAIARAESEKGGRS